MQTNYSIVIPTRNGMKYLPYAIKSVLASNREDIELVVSNNFSTDGTGEYLKTLSDSRLRVVSPDVSLPMAGHYEFAISQARGNWITLVGDDDAVMPNIFERLDYYISKDQKLDIISSIRAYYFWPGGEIVNSRDILRYQSQKKAVVRSTRKDLILTLAGLRSCFDMPQIYTTSIIKRSLYEEIRKKSGGCFYHSIIPDMYSVVALCLSRSKYLRIEEPLFWVGSSNKSMGISDRIYRDAEEFRVGGNKEKKCVPLKISDLVSYKLHSNAFSALYIYEALLQSPLKQNWHEGKFIRFLVLSAILKDSRKTTVSEKKRMFSEIKGEAKQHGISIFLIRLAAIIIRVVEQTNSITRIPKLFFSRLGLIPGWKRFKSTDHKLFPTILEASDKIREMFIPWS